MDRRWDKAMDRAADFVFRHGRLPKRHSSDPDEEQLANWLYYMRALHNRGRLSPERAQRLDSLGHWHRSPKVQDENASWTSRVADLEVFTARTGRLPRRGKNADEHEWSLALFINRQRRRSRNNTLPARRSAQLDAAVPGWNTRDEPRRLRQARDQHAAAWARVEPHAAVVLAGLASGRSPAQMAAMTGLPYQLIFGLARHNTQWAGRLEEALMQGRNPALEHGTHTAYRHGCRCKECRNLIAGYRRS